MRQITTHTASNVYRSILHNIIAFKFVLYIYLFIILQFLHYIYYHKSIYKSGGSPFFISISISIIIIIIIIIIIMCILYLVDERSVRMQTFIVVI